MTPQIFSRAHHSFDLADNVPSGHDAEADAHVPIRRFGKTVAAAFLKRCARMLQTDWRILLWSKETAETIIASYGSVQIHQVPGGCFAQTCVKGDMTPARGTALLRLVKYVSGDNQRVGTLDAERPVLQQRKAPGLWQVAVRLTAVDDVPTAPVPRARKIKIIAQAPTTWAVVTRHGRPTERAIERAETAIKNIIARSPWFAAGAATIRIHAPASLLPFVGTFEVAVPVFCHPQDQSSEDCIGSRGAGRAPAKCPANPPSLPVH
jgi:SOUL heme-binding protein